MFWVLWQSSGGHEADKAAEPSASEQPRGLHLAGCAGMRFGGARATGREAAASDRECYAVSRGYGAHWLAEPSITGAKRGRPTRGAERDVNLGTDSLTGGGGGGGVDS